MISLFKPATALTLPIDPRYYQLLVQTGLLTWGILFLQIHVPATHVAAAIIAALGTQVAFTHYLKLPANLLSSMNSSLSIILLLHAANEYWIALASVIAISSKFLLRYRNRHIFNPSNFGIVSVLMITPSAWAAPGQWGQALWITLLLAGCGLVLLMGVSRMLTSLSFLLVFSGLTFIRAAWLGDPLSIPAHQLQNGAVLIFAFFMLSDPMTTPNTPWGRLIFGSWVAILSGLLHYAFYIPNAFLYALAFSMPIVFILNHYYQGQRYHWQHLHPRRLLK